MKRRPSSGKASKGQIKKEAAAPPQIVIGATVGRGPSLRELLAEAQEEARRPDLPGELAKVRVAVLASALSLQESLHAIRHAVEAVETEVSAQR